MSLLPVIMDSVKQDLTVFPDMVKSYQDTIIVSNVVTTHKYTTRRLSVIVQIIIWLIVAIIW